MLVGLGLCAYYFVDRFCLSELRDDEDIIRSKFTDKQKVILLTNVGEKFRKGDTVTLDKYQHTVYLEAKGQSHRLKWVDLHQYVDINQEDVKPTSKSYLIVGSFLFLLGGLLPNKETATYMAGAYVIQSMATSDEVIEMGNLAYKATLNQLRKWAETSPELNTLIDAYENVETVTTPSN
jgi:hypothetical protein